MQVDLRSAIHDDAEYILELEAICMREYATALWGRWRPSATPETLPLDGHEIITLSGSAIGCMQVRWEADHCFVEKLYIAPQYQNQGFGAQVLRHIVGNASQRGLGTKLSVLSTNPAIKFYQREGFVIETETPERRRMIRVSDAQSAL